MSMHSKAGLSRAHELRTPHGPGLRLLFLFPLALMLLCTGCASKQVAQQGLEKPVVATGKADTLLAAARSKIGVPYRFGGTSPETGFDCSGFVCWSYEQVGVKLPRRASDQAAFGTPVQRKELKPGDIVTFKGTRGRTNWHAGIYTGNGKFIHSPNKGKTVTESNLDEDYYSRRFYAACRIPMDGSAEGMYSAYLEKERARAVAAKSAKKGQKSATVAKAKSGGKKSAKAKSKKSAAAPDKTKTAAAPSASGSARKDKKS